MALHVVFGAGQVGPRVAELLRQKGHQVRVVRRSQAPVSGGIEVVSGDVRDPAFARAAAAGADAIYHCMNPSAYTAAAWETEFPAMGESLIAAAVSAGARLVALDNLYGYGPVRGPRAEDTPQVAEGTKGRVRIAWARRLQQAAREEGLRYVAGRAGDFYGPGTGEQSLLGTSAIEGLAKGRPVLLIGDADATHAFSYVPDVVSGLVALGTAGPVVEGQTFHLPVHEVAPRLLVQKYAAALGVKPRIFRLPWWSIHALAPVVPILRELRETLYQWDRPFLVDDSRFRAMFPGLAAGVDEAVARHAALLRAAPPEAGASASI